MAPADLPPDNNPPHKILLPCNDVPLKHLRDGQSMLLSVVLRSDLTRSDDAQS